MPNLVARWRARLAQIPPLHALLLALAVACLVMRARGMLPFIADDAFISLRYARRLLDGHGLTWTDGQPVEGYSNLLWVLGCALLGWFGIDLVAAARGLGMAATIGTLAVLAWSTRARPWLACLASLAVLALAEPVAVWTIGGLEQPLFGLCLALGLVCAFSLLPESEEPVGGTRPMLAGLFFGLAALTRPDGVLFAAAVAVVLLFARRPNAASVRMVIRFIAPVVGMVLAQLLFRLLYYGDFVPNTGRAKLAISPAHILRGWCHVWEGLVSQRSVFVLAAAGLVLAWRHGRRHRVLLIAAPIVGWLCYLTLVGGDIFPAWRHFVPVLILCAFLIAEGATSALRFGASARWVVAILLVNACLLGIYDRNRDFRLALARSERWEWNGEVIGRFLGQAFGSKAPLLAVDSAGCIPYFSSLPSLDMLGLNDAYLGHHPPEDFGESTSLGHELGNGPYVLAQKPDLVIFCLPGGGEKPCFRSGREMVQLDGFRDHYQLVAFEGEHPYRYRSLIWVRRDSEKIGVEASADRVTIPGFLVGDTTVTSRLDPAGRVATEIPPQARVSLPELPLSAGRWSLTMDADRGEQLLVWVDAKAVDRTAAPILPDHAQLEISNPGSESVHLRSIVLARAAPHSEASP